MQHFREAIMSLERCDVFVDKRRKSDLHFLCYFQKYCALWAGVRNLEFPKVKTVIYFNSAFSPLKITEEMSFAVFVEPLKEMYLCHVCRSYLNN